jgi:ectoine hydroxylase-related dioxygenase (phytanoyl-CoA dioxygenase family)
MLVTPNVRAEYERDGVVLVQKAVSEQWIEDLQKGCDLAQENASPYGEYLQQPTDDGIYFTDLELAKRLPVFSTFAQYGPTAAVAGTVMGSSSARFIYDQLFIKEQGVSTMTPWHQDGSYWRIQGDQIASVFVALDPIQPGDGLDFVIGSQHWELANPKHFSDGTGYEGTTFPEMPDVDALTLEEKVQLKNFDMQPGDVLVFSSRIVHGGPGFWGRALTTRWAGDDAVYWNRPGESAIPTTCIALANGEPLAHNDAAFPQVWTA